MKNGLLRRIKDLWVYVSLGIVLLYFGLMILQVFLRGGSIGVNAGPDGPFVQGIALLVLALVPLAVGALIVLCCAIIFFRRDSTRH
jgi:hypothetical protein